MAALPDPERLGGLGWAERTKGALTRAERRHLLAEIVRGQGGYVATRVRRATGRVPEAARGLSFADFRPPDSKLARSAEEAAEEQSLSVKRHGYRTWAYGTALSFLDGQEPDPEVFYVAALLHDYGCDSVTAGEDFVLRSALRAAQVADDAGLGELGTLIGDSISVHSTPGLTVEKDGAPGFYVSAGAALDLAGLRCGEVPKSYFDQVHTAHPREGDTKAFVAHIAAEAKANPSGRFAQLRRCGFNLLLRVNPLD